jgi:hypothetical protein
MVAPVEAERYRIANMVTKIFFTADAFPYFFGTD